MLTNNGSKRIEFLKKHHLYGSIGENCSIQKRKLPLYSNLIFLHNNVHIASSVGFVTHDIIHKMLNIKFMDEYVERVGCIEVMDNVFIGSGTRILYNTRIGSNVIIGSDSLVNKDIPDNSVFAGVPARYICSFDEYVEKAGQYSKHFKETYGLDKIILVNDKLAKELYNNFIKEKNRVGGHFEKE
jgi:acetyltransferase-like isoleucine patch superfamily enzyme